jgi:phage shock protein A
MGIVDRIKLNARANINHILSKAENPQKMLDQFLSEMRNSIQEVREAVSTAIVGVKKLEREISDSAEKVDHWQERALLAMKRDNEELARKALGKKLLYVEKERKCKEELEKQKETVEDLKASLSELEAKLDELYQRRIDLIKQHAKLQKRAAQVSATKPISSQLDLDIGVFDTYDRMVDKVITMEAQAEALSELAEMDEVESEFEKLEKETVIESELKAIKDKVQS